MPTRAKNTIRADVARELICVGCGKDYYLCLGSNTRENWDSYEDEVFQRLCPNCIEQLEEDYEAALGVDGYTNPSALRERREGFISRVLDTPEGRKALAEAMVEPIKRSLSYQSIGRKLLMVDELPQMEYSIMVNNQ